AGSPLAMAAAAAVAFFVVPLPGVGWRAVFVASAGLAVLAFAGRWAMPGPERVATGERLPASALWSPAYRRTSLVLLLVLTLHMAGFWCVYAELPAALVGRHQVAPRDVGWFQIQVNAVHVVADVAFGLLAAAFGRRALFVVFCLLFAAGHLVVLARLDAVANDFGAFTVAAVAMGLGAGTWSCFGALFGAHYPEALRATAAATFYALARAVQLPCKPLLAGSLAAGSFAPALWIGATCAVLSAVAVLALPRPGPAR
ncbi:MAG: MFS transporter, partial [Planctomycetota bacterium]